VKGEVEKDREYKWKYIREYSWSQRKHMDTKRKERTTSYEW